MSGYEPHDLTFALAVAGSKGKIGAMKTNGHKPDQFPKPDLTWQIQLFFSVDDIDIDDTPTGVAFTRITRPDGMRQYHKATLAMACAKGFFVGPGEAEEVIKLIRAGFRAKKRGKK